MAILADSFMADLDELSDSDAAYILDKDNVTDTMEEDVREEDIKALNSDDLDSVSKLRKTRRYINIMQKVEDALEKGFDISTQGIVVEDIDSEEYQLIKDCNALIIDIENEILILHNFIRDKYKSKFPELESLVPQYPIDYARVVKRIGNETDLSRVDLQGLLPAATILVVSIMGASTSGKPLSAEDTRGMRSRACSRFNKEKSS